MKKSLAFLGAVLGVGACIAQAIGQPASDLRQVSAQNPAPSFAPRRLSVEERAELRRQLAEYSRMAGKRP